MGFMRLIFRLFKLSAYGGFALLVLYFTDNERLQQLRPYVVLFTHKIVANVDLMSDRVTHLVSWGHSWVKNTHANIEESIEPYEDYVPSVPVPKSLTIYAVNRPDQLVSDVQVSCSPDPNSRKIKVTGIWDTGATSTSVTKNVARRCGLEQVGTTLVTTASTTEPIEAPTYYVNVTLPNGVVFANVLVHAIGNLNDEAGMLIGMDIIGEGDFAGGESQGRATLKFVTYQEKFDLAE